MKKLFFVIALLFSVTAFSQSITTITPTNGQSIYEPDNTFVRIPVSATLDATAYAVVFSVDPIGKTKVLKGKNQNLWGGVAFPSSNGNYMFYELTSILDGIEEGEHTLRVDVYGKNFRDLVDTQEVTFYITN